MSLKKVPLPVSMWTPECRQAIIKAIPELEETVNDYVRQATAAGCPNCTRTKLAGTLTETIWKYDPEGRPTAALAELLGEEYLAAWRRRYANPLQTPKTDIPAMPPAQPGPGPRPACLDCVRKHIGQAIVLLGESKMGYPAHRWLAVAHLSEASEECLADYPVLAMELRTERLRLMTNPAYLPDLMPWFDRIDDEQALKIQPVGQSARPKLK